MTVGHDAPTVGVKRIGEPYPPGRAAARSGIASHEHQRREYNPVLLTNRPS
jgi:hypothetical protein